MISRRHGLAGALSLLALPVPVWPALAQQRRRSVVIGYIGNGPEDYETANFALVKDAMGRQGWLPPLARYEFRTSNLDATLLARHAGELATMGVDIIVSYNTNVAIAAHAATGRIPIINCVSGDPVAAGLAESLRRPGKNVTGLSLQSPEVMGKLVSMLIETVPTARRIGMLANPDSPIAGEFLAAAAQVASRTGIAVTEWPTRTEADIWGQFEAMVRAGTQAVIVPLETLFFAHIGGIVDQGNLHDIPVVAGWRRAVNAGALMGFGPSLSGIADRCAGIASRILDGASPSEIPFEQPTLFELGVNLAVARSRRVVIPSAVMAFADEVIE